MSASAEPKPPPAAAPADHPTTSSAGQQQDHTQQQQPHGKSGRYSGRSSRRGGGGGAGGGGGGSEREANGNGSLGSNSERRKRPDVQHYKPPGAQSTKDEMGRGNENPEMQEPHLQNSGPKKESRGGRGRRQQQQHHGELDQVAGKVANLNVGDDKEAPKGASGGGGGGGGGSGSGGGSNSRRKKKPEQPHYVPKKGAEEVGDKGGEREKAPAAADGAPDEKTSPPVDPSKKAEQPAPPGTGGGGGGRSKRKGKKDKVGGNKEGQEQPEGAQPRGDRGSSSAHKQQQQGRVGNKSQDPEFHDDQDGGRKHNGFAANEQKMGKQNSDVAPSSSQDQRNFRRNDRFDQQQRPPRNDDHLPPRLREQRKENPESSSRGGRREFHRGGGGQSRGSRGGKQSRGNSPHNRRPDSRKTSPSRHEASSSLPVNVDAAHQNRETSTAPVAVQPRGGIRSPSPRSSQDARLSHSPPARPGSSPGPQLRRGGGGGGSTVGRGASRGLDWGNRYFRESSQDEEYYGDSSSRWDDRGGLRGKPPSGKGHVKTIQPKTTLPPRFQRVKEQQFKPEESHQDFEAPQSRRGGGEFMDSGARSWRGEDPKVQRTSQEPYRQARPPERSNDRQQHQQLGSVSIPTSSQLPPALSSRPPAEAPRMLSDWSLEVEEEEERMEMRRSSSDREPVTSHANINHRTPNSGSIGQFGATGGGILRLPSSNSAASVRDPWSSGLPADNPAWRGVAQDLQRAGPGHRGVADRQPPSQRFLFDPKNPNKPIPAAGSRPPGSNGEPGMMTRFPVDPRFPPRMPLPGPGPVMGYRPPFPTSQNFGPPRPSQVNLPDWYDFYNQHIYGGDKKHDISVITHIIRNDMALRRIYMEGGGKVLCQLWNTDVLEHRRRIQDAFEHLLKTDLVFCAEYDVEFHIWKIAFYHLVEVLKQGLRDESPEVREIVQKNISELLDEGIEFYSQMLGILDATYKLDLKVYYDVLEPRPSDKHIRCALMSAQKCLLCLGDLARYKEQIQESSNYGIARQYYQKASNIEPRNGRPFNQLAILSANTKRKFEAVYYNMRCLQSKNPFSSSHEGLTVIFEEVKKKWDAGEKKRLEEKEQRRRTAEKEKERDDTKLTRGTRLRKEIWIRPEGGKRLHRTTSAHEADGDTEEGELREMSTSDLNRRFNNTFLYLIGKLYTHINMDTFPLALELLQKEFRILVSRSPLPIDSKRLVQIMALNMFVIEHTKMKSGDSDNYRSAMQDAALQLAFEMFGILIERCNVLLKGFRPVIDSASQCIFAEEDLPTLLSSVKVWCDWLLGNNDTWYPVVSEDPFSQLAQLATHLEKLKPLLRPILSKLIVEEDWAVRPDKSNYELIKLGEDALLCGFDPWFRGLDWAVYRRFVPRSIPSGLAQDVRRLDAINFCIEFLEGLEHPILKWSLPDNAHISLVENQSTPQEKINARLSNMLATEQDIIDESYSDEEASSIAATAHQPNFDGGNKLVKLKQRKDELERRRMEEEREARRMQRQILAEHVNVTLEIRPRFLVPDTNCFVDYLEEIRRLASCNQYQLRVPTIVLNELDGLAKGARPAKYATKEHASMVSENARRALAFLRDRPANIKCVTSKGTLVPSLAVTTEEDCEDGKKNDDLILDACINVNIAEQRGQQQQHQQPQQDERGVKMRVVHREVVLLTDDRNLKLKAHVTDIPVNKVPDFLKWAFANGGDGPS